MKNCSEGNVVKEFNIGKTKVKICDDYCKGKTQDEINEILKNIARRVVHNLKEDAYL